MRMFLIVEAKNLPPRLPTVFEVGGDLPQGLARFPHILDFSDNPKFFIDGDELPILISIPPNAVGGTKTGNCKSNPSARYVSTG